VDNRQNRADHHLPDDEPAIWSHIIGLTWAYDLEAAAGQAYRCRESGPTKVILMEETRYEVRPEQDGLSRRILKNTVFITAGSIGLKVLNFLFNIYVVRRLGDDRFGQYSIVLAWVGLFQIFAELGMSQYVMREIARDHKRASTLFWNLVALRLLLAFVGIVGITAGAALVGYSPILVLGVFLYTWTFVLSAFDASLTAVLVGNERWDYVTALTIVGQIAFMLLGALVLFNGLDFIALIAVGLVAMLPAIVLAIWFVQRHRLINWKININPRAWPGLVRSGLAFGMISLALTIAYSIDTVMLTWFVPENVVGWYNVAYHLARSLVGFLSGFSVAMVPSLARVYYNDPVQAERWYYRSFKFILLVSLPVAVGGMLLAFPITQFLYASEFIPSALGLQILIWDVPLLMFTAFCGNMTTVIGEEKAAARIYSINAVANVVLNLYAIPHFGLVGAALVTVVTDLIGALQFHFLLRRKLSLPHMTSIIVRVVCASLLMGVAVWALGNLNLLVVIALGAAFYGVLALGMRLLDSTEWALVLRLVSFARRPTSPNG
jgi:O-antigen/teichoic acid export membrane protein